MGWEASLPHLTPVHTRCLHSESQQLSLYNQIKRVQELFSSSAAPERRRLTSCMAAALALPRVLQGAPTHLDRKLAFWLGHCCVWHWIMRVRSPWRWCFPSRNHRPCAWGQARHWRGMPAGQRDPNLVRPHCRPAPHGKGADVYQDHTKVWADS